MIGQTFQISSHVWDKFPRKDKKLYSSWFNLHVLSDIHQEPEHSLLSYLKTRYHVRDNFPRLAYSMHLVLLPVFRPTEVLPDRTQANHPWPELLRYKSCCVSPQWLKHVDKPGFFLDFLNIPVPHQRDLPDVVA